MSAGQSSSSWRAKRSGGGAAAAARSGERALRAAAGLKHGAAPLSALCSWKIHVYGTSCPGGSQACSAPAGRTPAEGSSPSILFPERVSQRGFVAGSGFVARLLFWKQTCSCVPWPFCPSAKGPAVKEDCPDHPPQAGFPQACLPQLFLIANTDQRWQIISNVSRRARSWLPELLWQETITQWKTIIKNNSWRPVTPMCQLSGAGRCAQTWELQFHSSKNTVRSACCVGIIFGTNGNRRKVDVTPSLKPGCSFPKNKNHVCNYTKILTSLRTLLWTSRTKRSLPSFPSLFILLIDSVERTLISTLAWKGSYLRFLKQNKH